MQIPVIANGVVVNVVDLDEGVDWSPPEGCTIGPAGGRMGDIWDGVAYKRPLPPSPTKNDLAAIASDKRWQVEVGGFFTTQGHHIATDRESQTKLLAEMVAIGAGLRADPSPWKLMGNGFVFLTNAQMLQVIGEARQHIASAFATEAVVLAKIDGGTITTTEKIDAASWPSNDP